MRQKGGEGRRGVMDGGQDGWRETERREEVKRKRSENRISIETWYSGRELRTL